jgi:hypothetical protein
MILVFIYLVSFHCFGLFLTPHRENSFRLFTQVVRKIPGEVTRKSDGPTNRPRVKTTAQGLRVF